MDQLKKRAVAILARSDVRDLGIIIMIVGIWRVCLELVNQLLVSGLPGVQYGVHGLSRWANWDGGWYLGIIQNWYVVNPAGADAQQPYAFFPLFPGTVRIVSDVTTLNPIYVASVFNALCLVGILYFTYNTARLLSERSAINELAERAHIIGWLAVVAVLITPASLFFAALYADALLVMLFAGACYFLLTKRYLLSAMCLLFASATKTTALLMVPMLCTVVLLDGRSFDNLAFKQVFKKLPLGILVGFVSILGALLYMAYLGVNFGNPLLFYTTQSAWGRDVDGFFLGEIWRNFYQHILTPSYFSSRIDYLTALIAMLSPFFYTVCAGAVAYWHKKTMWWAPIFALLVFVVPLSTGIIQSVNRYALLLTPIAGYVIGRLVLVLYLRNKVATLILGGGFAAVSIVVLFLQATAFLQFQFVG